MEKIMNEVNEKLSQGYSPSNVIVCFTSYRYPDFIKTENKYSIEQLATPGFSETHNIPYEIKIKCKSCNNAVCKPIGTVNYTHSAVDEKESSGDDGDCESGDGDTESSTESEFTREFTARFGDLTE